jgi:hypothetical protein
MHHPLTINEILTLVLEYFSGVNGELDLQTLAAAARTCKSFKDPALDILWRSLDDFDPLLELLPLTDDGEENESFGVIFRHNSIYVPLLTISSL